MNTFTYKPSQWVPFKDLAAIDRVIAIPREDLDKHPNPKFHIHITSADAISYYFVSDIITRIKASDDENRRTVLIFPNPVPDYWKVAYMINKLRINCRNLWVFAMDEYANEDGVIAPPDWRFGFIYAMNNFFYANIDEDLRPPKNQMVGPTMANFRDYGKMIEDLGGADACYSGPGWTGHLAFIEPDAPNSLVPHLRSGWGSDPDCNTQSLHLGPELDARLLWQEWQYRSRTPTCFHYRAEAGGGLQVPHGCKQPYSTRHHHKLAASHHPPVLPWAGDTPIADFHPPAFGKRLLYLRGKRDADRAGLG